MVIFHSYVTLPEGIYKYISIYIYVIISLPVESSVIINNEKHIISYMGMGQNPGT